jgi:hypothetical protein
VIWVLGLEKRKKRIRERVKRRVASERKRVGSESREEAIVVAVFHFSEKDFF